MSWRVWFNAEEPAPPFDDPILGTVTWIEDTDGWCGTFNGFRFVLTHERTSPPPAPLRAYAVEFLSDREWVEGAIAEAIATSPPYLRHFADEMRELEYEELRFSIGARGRGVFAVLGPGRDFRCWRLEFDDLKCLGIGFDT